MLGGKRQTTSTLTLPQSQPQTVRGWLAFLRSGQKTTRNLDQFKETPKIRYHASNCRQLTYPPGPPQRSCRETYLTCATLTCTRGSASLTWYTDYQIEAQSHLIWLIMQHISCHLPLDTSLLLATRSWHFSLSTRISRFVTNYQNIKSRAGCRIQVVHV
jgi:hypothetical protein